MSSSHADLDCCRFTMRCAVCGQQRSRKGWFRPQWEADRPVVHVYSGDYDRCKACYYNYHNAPPAPPTNEASGEDPATSATAKTLCVDMRLQATRCGMVLTKFMAKWIEDNMHNAPVKRYTNPPELYREWGTVDCELATDPKQVEYPGERWTFDPQNRVYEKAFHLAWPQLVGNKNMNTLGNILESMLGVRNAIAKYPECAKKLEAQRTIDSVCKRVSKYVNSVYQFTQATETSDVEVNTWCDYVRDLAPATA